jgi:hypothetical protein
VATDQSAAPGLFAEIGITAAQLAVQQLGEAPGQLHRDACRRRKDRSAAGP